MKKNINKFNFVSLLFVIPSKLNALSYKSNFVNDSVNTSMTYNLMFIVPIMGLILSFILWKNHGKEEKVIETVEFYPPKGFNSLEIGFLYKGKADDKDITSLLIYLANKGYIKITQIEDKDFKITKIKEYDGSDENEKLFLMGLFDNSISIDFSKAKELMKQSKANGKKTNYWQAVVSTAEATKKQTITRFDFFDGFSDSMCKMYSNINNKNNKDLIFEKNENMKAVYILLFIIATLVTVMLVPTLKYVSTDKLKITAIISEFCIVLFAVGLYINKFTFLKINWLIIASLVLFFCLSTVPIVNAIKDDYQYIIGLILGIICVIGMILLFKSMRKRTTYGNEMLGKIKRFKNFIETAEKEKLEDMVMNEPTYFYDILPFAYVLGVSDKWIKKFESISLQAPSWYDGYSSFSTSSFSSFITTTMTSIYKDISFITSELGK